MVTERVGVPFCKIVPRIVLWGSRVPKPGRFIHTRVGTLVIYSHSGRYPSTPRVYTLLNAPMQSSNYAYRCRWVLKRAPTRSRYRQLLAHYFLDASSKLVAAHAKALAPHTNRAASQNPLEQFVRQLLLQSEGREGSKQCLVCLFGEYG